MKDGINTLLTCESKNTSKNSKACNSIEVTTAYV
jgi:hypothetical protein